MTLYGTRDAERQTATLSFTIAGKDPAEVSVRLDENFGILCRAGLHCAPACGAPTLGTFRKARSGSAWAPSHARGRHRGGRRGGGGAVNAGPTPLLPWWAPPSARCVPSSSFQEAGIACKLIPVPRQIRSDCGLCLRVAAPDLPRSAAGAARRRPR